MIKSAIHTENLTIGYGKPPKERIVLAGLDLAANAGEITAILGANGTGKSTLLRTLAGLQSKLFGEIWLAGENAETVTSLQRARLVSIVLTDRIYPGFLTVLDYVAMGRHPYTDWRGRLGKSDEEATLDALRMTGLTDLQGSDLYELSDGQLQKATIARALAQDGPIMMLDEPLIHLDIPSKWEIMNLLKRTTVERNKTIILATHELELSLELADRIWLINKQGELIAGKPNDLVLDGTIANAFNTTHYRFQDRHIFKSGI